MPIRTGDRFDRYEIISPIGVGGMGQVYLARDTRMDRRIALKVLPPSFTNDPERVQRFKQEARAASALNHPNIITIFEVGEIEETYYIASEYIEGETLRRRMMRGLISVQLAVEIVRQIAAALGAAHAAGIMHRDIKPENIMIRPDGYVKVLDFGLAKLIRPEISDEQSGSTFLKTDPGLILGTAPYMSPEQARGQKVDARSDIFSLGIVFYELIAGRSPFLDQTPSDIMAAILQREPVPLGQIYDNLPQGLDEIVQRALAKPLEARYQNIEEMRADLRKLRPDGAVPAARTGRFIAANPTTYGQAGSVDAETSIEAVNRKTSLPAATDRSDGLRLTDRLALHRTGFALGVAFLILILLSAGYGVARLMKRDAPTAGQMRLERIPATGRVIDASISPDGKSIAYLIEDGSRQSMWMKQVSVSGRPIQLVQPSQARFRSLTFSRDGDHIYYVMRNSNETVGDAYRIPALGGMPHKMASVVSSPVTLSPDDRSMAFVRELKGRGTSALVTVDPITGRERVLAGKSLPESFSVDGPAWSPDGLTIALTTTDVSSGVSHYLTFIRVSDGTETSLRQNRWSVAGRVDWVSDGKSVVLPARNENSNTRQIWSVGFPSGKIGRITNDLSDYRGVSVTRDGTTIATLQLQQVSNIWVSKIDNPESSRQITTLTGNYDGLQGLAWTADGRIVYTSSGGGSTDLWIMNADGSGQRQLTVEAGNNNYPSVSFDDRYVVFSSDRNGKVAIWRIDIDGGNPRQLTFGQLDLDPQCSKHGWVVYSSISTGQRNLWKVPIEGGRPEKITSQFSDFPVVSPDGEQIAYTFRDERSINPDQVFVIGVESGNIIGSYDIPTNPWRLIRWYPDGRGLTFAESDDQMMNIWLQPLNRSARRRLTDYKTSRLFAYEWSRDGRFLASARGLETREIVLIRGFR